MQKDRKGLPNHQNWDKFGGSAGLRKHPMKCISCRAAILATGRLGKESVDRLYERYGSGVRVSGRIYSVRTAVEMLAKGNSGEVICGGTCRVAYCGTIAWAGVEQFV